LVQRVCSEYCEVHKDPREMPHDNKIKLSIPVMSHSSCSHTRLTWCACFPGDQQCGGLTSGDPDVTAGAQGAAADIGGLHSMRVVLDPWVHYVVAH
jgi:hypothetical protein